MPRSSLDYFAVTIVLLLCLVIVTVHCGLCVWGDRGCAHSKANKNTDYRKLKWGENKESASALKTKAKRREDKYEINKSAWAQTKGKHSDHKKV